MILQTVETEKTNGGNSEFFPSFFTIMSLLLALLFEVQVFEITAVVVAERDWRCTRVRK